MQVAIVLAVFVSAVCCGIVPHGSLPNEDGLNTTYFLFETSDGVIETEYLNAEIEATASDSDVSYHFYSKKNPSTDIDVSTNNVATLRNTAFKITKDTFIIIHGWRNDKNSAVNTQIRTALLSKYDVNVFVVDWSSIASKNYVTAKSAVVPIGGYVSEFVQQLVSTFRLNLSKLVLVGHSLGAHVSGNAGAALKGQVKHIVGLDPAWPLFTTSNTANRLDPTDAKFVQIVHTNAGLLGFSSSIGHSDYYPNGGSRQPGCGVDASGSCAHGRSYVYFAESVSASKNLFVATSCSSYKVYSRGKCGSNAKSVLGGYAVDTKASGDYYLDTNSASPYAKG